MHKDGEATQSGGKALVLKLQQAFSFYKITWQKAISENASLDELAAIHTSPQGKGMSQLQKVGERKALCKSRTIVGARR